MISTPADAAVFGLFLFVVFIVVYAVSKTLISKCAGALRGWLG